MVQDILYGQEARERILTGVHILSTAVKATLGPEGRESLFINDSGLPLLVKNGREIAASIDLEDTYENMGAGMIKQMISSVYDAVGDGTSTAVVLADAMIQEGCRNIAAGANAMEIRKGIQGAVQLSCAALKKIARPADSIEDIRSVSTIAAGDEAVGKLVADAMEKLGSEGILSAEETPNIETTLEIIEGMQYEKGYLHADMLKDPGKMEEELQNPYILVTDGIISNAQEILPLLEEIRKNGRSLLVIAEKVTDGALSVLLLNKKQRIIDVTVVHPPAYGEGRQAFMEDICVFTGGIFITEGLGHSLKNTTLEMLGTAQKVIISKHRTMIINGNGKKSEIKTHMESLRCLIQKEEYGFKKERLQERLARFSSGAAVIKVGAPTETEMKELKYRVDSAVQAAKAAIAEGIVAGGGTAYLDILPVVQAYAKTLEGDQKTGAHIVLKALEAPIRQIAENGGKDPSVICCKVKEMKRGNGYDLQKDSFGDMTEKGILDSAKTVRLALQCGASAAAALLTIEAGVAFENKTQ